MTALSTITGALVLALGGDAGWAPVPAVNGSRSALPSSAWSRAETEPAQFQPIPLPASGAKLPTLSESRKPAWFPRIFRQDAVEVEPTKEAEEPTRGWSLFQRSSRAPSDGMLVSRCRAAFGQDHLLSKFAIQVEAKDSIVTLNGVVDDADLRERAERLASSTAGVREVRNELLVVERTNVWRPDASIRLRRPLSADVSRPLEGGYAGVLARPPEWIHVIPSGATSSGPTPLGPQEIRLNVGGGPSVATYLVRREAPPDPRQLAWKPGPIVPWSGSAESADSLHVAKAAILPITTHTRPAAARADDVANIPQASRDALQPVSAHVIPVPPRPLPRAVPIAPEAWSAPAPSAGPALHGPRQDVNEVLLRHTAGSGLRYRIDGEEVILSGSVASPNELHSISAELMQVPGVSRVGWEDMRFLGY